MSGIVSGLGNLIGGNSAKTDRKYQLGAWGDLNNIFNFGMAQGQGQTAQGEATTQAAGEQLGAPAAYYQNLLTGNRAAALNAVAPTANAAAAQSDAAQRQLSTMGTSRGGGTAAMGQQIATQKQAAIDKAIQEARSGAAAGATQVAGQTAAVGGQQLNAAMRLLGLGEESASTVGSQAGGSRVQDAQLHANAVNNLVNSIWGSDEGSASDIAMNVATA